MKISNLSVNKQFLDKLKTRAISITLITSAILGLASCSKNQDKEEIGYKVSGSLGADGLYTKIVDRSKFYSDNYDFSNTIRTMNFATVSESKVYGTTFFNDKTSAFYRENVKIVLPDSYSMYNTNEWLSIDNFDYTLKYEKVRELAEESYDVITSSMEAKRDLETKVALPEGQKEFMEGDTINSKAIYHDGQLIAYYQDGVGSECENVKNALIGDANNAIGSITSYYNLSDNIDITFQELYHYQDDMNKNYKNKSL